MWQFLGRLLVVVAALVLLMSFAGDLHGVGDSLAVFRPFILIGTFVVCALVWRWRVAQAGVVAVFVIAGWHTAGFVPSSIAQSAVDLTVYQKNMLFRPRDRATLIDDIHQMNADIVTLQEVSRANLPMLESLSDRYPYQLVCNAHSVGAVAILSQTPFQSETCAQAPGLAGAVTVVRGQLVQAISVHLHWPWPYAQRDHAKALIAELAPLPNGATVIGGDFNMVASGRTLAWFEQATGTKRVGRLMRSYDLFGYPLGIDHVLATGGAGTLDVRPQLSSDHFGIFARIDLP